MPIVGLTDQNSYDPTRSMSMIGKIKKGAPKENGLKDLDYFRFDLQPNFAHYADVLAQLYTSEPKQFDDVIFVEHNPNKAFDSWYEKWGGGQQLKIRCDGQQIVKRMTDNFQHSYHPTPCINQPDKPCGCKQVGRLCFVLSKFSFETGVYGYFMLETHSIYDIGSIFQALTGVSEQFESIRNVQWVLERVPKEVNTPKQDRQGNITGRIKTTKSLLNIRPSEASIKQFIIPALQSQHILPEQVEVTENLLASGNQNEDIELDDEPEIENEVESSDGMSKFVELVQQVAMVTVVDVEDAFADFDYNSLSTSQKVAVFCRYWHEEYQEQKKLAKAISELHEKINLDDVLFELTEVETDG
jgi:hypothetical protein